MPRLGRARPARSYRVLPHLLAGGETVLGTTAAVTVTAPAGTVLFSNTVSGATALVNVTSPAGTAGALVPATRAFQTLILGPQGLTPGAGNPASALLGILKNQTSTPPAWVRSQQRRATFSYTNYPFLPSIVTEAVSMPANAELDANILVTGLVTSSEGVISQGSFATGSIVTVTSAYTAAATDAVILANATGGAFTVTLPDATQMSAGFATGQRYTLKKIDSTVNAVTVAGTGTQKIDGASTYALSTQYQKVTVLFDGANWQTI